jgi:4-hydroxybenzoate polyprenyltransferase
MSRLVFLAQLSRWRFWLYLGGTYLVGYTAGASSLDQFKEARFWAHLLFFMFPANLLLYGLNDLFDSDTDVLNPKKGSMELRLDGSVRPSVLRAVLAAFGLALILAFYQRRPVEVLLLGLFCGLSVAYSTPPIRLKARPVLDSASNILYALPGFLGYHHAGGGAVTAFAVITAGLWTAAMHLFSAIPDIKSDVMAGVRTSATVLGTRGSLAVCALMWSAFAGIVIHRSGLLPWSLGLTVYPVIPLVLLLGRSDAVGRVYWYFPIINALVGAGAFFVLVGRL